ncbi:Retrovirus-related Pol polyprotein [Arachis hypogaea]|nr:Retrovirus-related Pol polyprotein [Arachis hypogaea]
MRGIKKFAACPACTCSPTCACSLIGILRSYCQDTFVVRFLRGLNDQYSTARTNIMMMKPLPSVDIAFSFVLQQERQLLGNDSFDSKPLLNAVERQTNYTPSLTPRGRGRDIRGGRSNIKQCSFSDKTGHLVDTCYKKYGMSPHIKQRMIQSANNITAEIDENEDSDTLDLYKDSNNAGVSFTLEQKEAILALLQQ